MRVLTRTVPLCAMVLLSGCAAFMHTYTSDDYANRTLSPDSKDGAYRLDLESKVDLTIRIYIADHGTPDYFRVVDADTVYLFYLNENLVAEFVRPPLETNSQVTPHHPIPSEQRSWLPIAAAEKLPPPVFTPPTRVVTPPKPLVTPPTPVVSPPMALDECFAKCRELTDRSKEECFDACRD